MGELKIQSCVLFLALAVSFGAMACSSATTAPGNNPYWQPGQPGQPGPAGTATCDPAGCDAFCQQSSCMWDGDLDGSVCSFNCRQYCGNGFFDDSDTDVLACSANIQSIDWQCDMSHRCCSDNFTSEICGTISSNQ